MSQRLSCSIWIITVLGCLIQVRPGVSSYACPCCSHFSHNVCFLVGYFNYRYFCNFLLYVFFGMFYGALLSFRSFRAITSFQRGSKNVWAPARQDESAIAFGFMLCLSVGLAVACLGGFHLYLLLSAQTTIEFHGKCCVGDDSTDTFVCVTRFCIRIAHFVYLACVVGNVGNYTNKRRARNRGTTWVNPYDLGMRQNWQQVYGSKHPLMALLPSSREPEFLPIPIDGKLGRRRPKSEEEQSSASVASLGTNGIGIV